MENNQDKKRPNLADVQLAAVRLLLLPENDSEYTADDREFMRSDLVDELLYGKWPMVFSWTSLEKARSNG